MSCRYAIFAALILGTLAWADKPGVVIGHQNLELAKGARALVAGRHKEGVELTLAGLEKANGKREEEIALSNLCAGYTNLGDYKTAMKYCDIALARNDNLWRVYNSKALIYIYTKQYDKALVVLEKGEAINAGARSMKIARAMYLDAMHPVVPEIEIDDRRQSQ